MQQAAIMVFRQGCHHGLRLSPAFLPIWKCKLLIKEEVTYELKVKKLVLSKLQCCLMAHTYQQAYRCWRRFL